jgi:hypothetical protein
MLYAWTDRSGGEAGRRQCRWDLCHVCHDALATPIPVQSAISDLTALVVRLRSGYVDEAIGDTARTTDIRAPGIVDTQGTC